MLYVDKVLTCVQCRAEFVFPAGEQEFFHDKGFENDPKHCKQCRAKNSTQSGYKVRQETRTTCAECGKETTVPFKPTRGKPVLCRTCFLRNKEPASHRQELARVK